jgi:hypothetical protein
MLSLPYSQAQETRIYYSPRGILGRSFEEEEEEAQGLLLLRTLS